MNLGKIRKALMAGGGAAVAALLAAVQAHGTVSWADAGTAVGAGLTAGWATWAIPNAPASPTK